MTARPRGQPPSELHPAESGQQFDLWIGPACIVLVESYRCREEQCGAVLVSLFESLGVQGIDPIPQLVRHSTSVYCAQMQVRNKAQSVAGSATSPLVDGGSPDQEV